MTSVARNMVPVHPIERFLAILGASACLVITIAIWLSVSANQGMWPLPGLYFIELSVVAVASVAMFLRGSMTGRAIVWVAVGILLAFAILGAFSVGFAYLPIVLIFAIIAISSSARNKQPIAASLGVFLIGALAQVALMLALIP